MVTISNMLWSAGILLLLAGAKIYRLVKRNRELESQLSKIVELAAAINECLDTFSKHVEKINSSQLEFYEFSAERHNFCAVSLQWLLAVAKIYVMEAQQNAAENDNFNEAKSYQQMLLNLEALINHPITNKK